jgi:hypothetical protein
MSNPCKVKLVLSYDFQIRKQGGKSFSRHEKACFLGKLFGKEITVLAG